MMLSSPHTTPPPLPPNTHSHRKFQVFDLQNWVSLQNLMLCFFVGSYLRLWYELFCVKVMQFIFIPKKMVRTQNKKLNIVKIRLQKLRVPISSFCLPIEILILSQSVAIWPIVNPFISIYFFAQVFKKFIRSFIILLFKYIIIFLFYNKKIGLTQFSFHHIT